MHAELVVVGLGYVGLPVLIEASSSGVRCVGLDSDADKVAALSAGRSHIDDISDDQVARALAAGVSFTADVSCLGATDAVVICVPTPLDEHQAPDLSAVTAMAAAIAPRLTPGTLVVAGADRPGQSHLRPAQHPQGGRRLQRCLYEGGGGAVRTFRRRGGAGERHA